MAGKEKRDNLITAGANSSTLEQSWAKQNLQIKVTLEQTLLKSFYLRSSDKFPMTILTKIVYKLISKTVPPFR